MKRLYRAWRGCRELRAAWRLIEASAYYLCAGHQTVADVKMAEAITRLHHAREWLAER